MIPVSVMVTGRGTVSHRIKGNFGRGRPSTFSGVTRPVVVWNVTRACNLKCIHCYIRAGPAERMELSREEAMRLVAQMADIGVPLLIFSGGEPLLRKDIFDIAIEAGERGMKLALSSNGTLITRDVAREIERAGFLYVGISIDSPRPEWHDRFRGVRGAFGAALNGLMNTVRVGVPAGIRFTVTRYNVDDAPRIVELADDVGASRVTFYHLSAAGRATELGEEWYVTPGQYWRFIDYLIDVSRRYEGKIEVETTMAPFDGIAIADRVAGSREEFWDLMDLVRAQGGCGRKIVSIYPDGTVYPCQFVDFMNLGNVRRGPLREILEPDRPELDYFIETHKYLKGIKCSNCPFKEICNGGDRIRAYYLGGGLEADDPQCPLDTREIYLRWSGKEK